ncbi:MAG: LysM peptidoglycan-binding domain-containing protein [Gammaproteobacteria bacterium]
MLSMPRSHFTDRPHNPRPQKKSGNNPIIPRIEPKSDLLYRLRQRFSLPQSENSAVRQEIEWFAAHPDYLDRVFGRAERYLFYITEELEKRKMPSDLALLPIIESAYDPFAYSHGRAAGLWQIIPGTADQLGLKQNWWYDARRDVVDSTRGALDYLQQLHEMFQGDWLLAIAAYNSGAGNVTRALRRASAASEPTDFWHIKLYLPLETRAYIPRLLAIQKLVASPESYGVTLPSIANEAYFEIIDTGGQMDMTTAMELAGISGDQLYLLNPGINRWATNPDGPHRLLIPTQSAKMFLTSLLTLGERDRVRWTRHKVVSGETLSDLALRYQTTPKVLSEVNNLENDLIRADEHLMIPHAVKGPSAYIHSVDARTERKQNQPRKGQRQTHLVQQGESLWTISKHYKVGIRDLAIWNAMAPGDLLREGRRLVVWTTQPTPAHRQIPQKERIRQLTYVVRKGDSLSGIGNRFRVTIAELLKWNNISTNQYLQPGQQLVMYVDVTKQST